MSETVIEFCITKDQPAPLSMIIPDGGDRVRDMLAEGLYYGDVVSVIGVLGSYYERAPLLVGSRRKPYADVLIVDFIDRRVSDHRAFSHIRSKTFKRFIKKHGVPE